jgi:hypothetical protein
VRAYVRVSVSLRVCVRACVAAYAASCVQVHDLSVLTGGGSHCFRHLNWGYGGELTSVDGYLPDYVHEARVLMQALRTFAVQTFVSDPAAQTDLLQEVPDRATAAPRSATVS